jgi:hypothetical protein
MTNKTTVTVFTKSETIGTFELSSVPRKGEIVDFEWTRYKVVKVRTALDEDQVYVEVREARLFEKF